MAELRVIRKSLIARGVLDDHRLGFENGMRAEAELAGRLRSFESEPGLEPLAVCVHVPDVTRPWPVYAPIGSQVVLNAMKLAA